MIKGFAIAFVAFGCLNVHAQPNTSSYIQLSGKVADTAGQALVHATIQLIAGPDTLTTLSHDDGGFFFRNTLTRKFKLFITMRGYLSFSHSYAVPDGKSMLNLPPITLRVDYDELDPVIVTRLRPITIQGDTVSYNAAAFPVRDGSEVEDILKRLPGIEVDINGNVIIQGKPLAKVLVDGKEFFGSDVLLAIQNLPADIVNKIQVIDDYGDKARLTGIRSGDAAKVLNIVLRSDKRNGQFGRLDASGDAGKYSGSTFANDLHGQRQIGLRASASNNNLAGNDPAHNGGINYANQWEPRWGLVSSVSTSGQSPQSVVNLVTNSYYSGEALQQLQHNHNAASNSQSSGSSRLTFKPDPFTLLRLTTSGSIQSSNSHVTSNFSNIQQDSGYSKTTSGTSNNQAETTGQTFTAALHYEKTRPGNRRRYSIDANVGYTGARNFNDNLSIAEIVADSNNSSSYLDDLTTNDTRTWNAVLRLNYFVPISATAFFELGYGASNSISRTRLLTQEADSIGVLPTLVDSLSQNTRLSTLAHNVHAGYTAKIHQLDFTLAIDAQPGVIKGTADSKGDLTSYNYFSLLPALQAAWNLDKKQRLRFGYNGQPILPSLPQLSPLTNLSNPQYPITGNPNLRQSYTHHVSLEFEHTDLKATQFCGYGIGIDYSMTLRSIVSDLSTPRDNGQVIQATTFLNAAAASSIGANYHLTLPATFRRKFHVTLSGSIDKSSTITMTNGVQYPTESWNAAPAAHLQLLIPERVETDLSGAYGLTRSTFPGRTNPTITFRSASINLNSRHYFFRKWILNYQFVQAYTGTGGRLLTLPSTLTAGLQRQFLHHNSATVSIVGYNLFNQSAAVGETFSGTTSTQTSPQLTGRYFLLTLQLKFQRLKK